MNYKLYHLAAEHVLIKTLPSNYDNAWLESNVRDEYKDLTVRQIEGKIQELYRILQVAHDMGYQKRLDDQPDAEVAHFLYLNGADEEEIERYFDSQRGVE